MTLKNKRVSTSLNIKIKLNKTINKTKGIKIIQTNKTLINLTNKLSTNNILHKNKNKIILMSQKNNKIPYNNKYILSFKKVSKITYSYYQDQPLILIQPIIMHNKLFMLQIIPLILRCLKHLTNLSTDIKNCYINIINVKINLKSFLPNILNFNIKIKLSPFKSRLYNSFISNSSTKSINHINQTNPVSLITQISQNNLINITIFIKINQTNK